MIDIIGSAYLTGNIRHLKSVKHALPGQMEAIQAGGYSQFYVYEDSLRKLGGEVARTALSNAGLSANDIDFIVAAHSDVADFPSIDFSCQIGAEIGSGKVKTRNIIEGCGTAVTAFVTASQIIAENPSMTGLVVQAQNVSDVHHDRFSLLNGILSDAAVATIVTASRPEQDYFLRIQSFDEISMPYFVDVMRLEFGGGRHPAIPSSDDPDYYKPGRERMQETYQLSSTELLEFIKLRSSTMKDLIDSVSCSAEWEKPAKWLLHTLEGEQSIRAIANASNIENNNASLVAKHGHCGCADPILSFIDLSHSGSFTEGDRIVLSTISTGMKWAALSGVVGKKNNEQ